MLVKIENNQPIPYSVGQLRKENPNTSFPKNISEATLNSYGVFTVQEFPRPIYDPSTHKLVQQQVSGSGTTWSRGWDVVPLTAEELQRDKDKLIGMYTAAVQDMLDNEAKTQNFDSILTAVTYAGSGKARFSGKGNAARNWRDSVWDECYTILEDVELGNRAMPTVEELLAELPTINWPA